MNWYIGLDFDAPFQSEHHPYSALLASSELEAWRMLLLSHTGKAARAEEQMRHSLAVVNTATKRIEELTNG